MATNNPINVVAAFEILLKEIETEIAAVSEAGARAFADRNFSAAQEALGRAEQMTDLRARVDALRQEWITLAHSCGTGAGSTSRQASGGPCATPPAEAWAR